MRRRSIARIVVALMLITNLSVGCALLPVASSGNVWEQSLKFIAKNGKAIDGGIGAYGQDAEFTYGLLTDGQGMIGVLMRDKNTKKEVLMVHTPKGNGVLLILDCRILQRGPVEEADAVEFATHVLQKIRAAKPCSIEEYGCVTYRMGQDITI